MHYLSLTPLRTLSRFLETELTAFFGTRVTLEVTELLEAATELYIVDEEGASDTETHGFGLGRDTTTNELGGAMELLGGFAVSDRGNGSLLHFADREIGFEGAAVNFVAGFGSREKTNTGNGGLAATDGFEIFG